MPIIQIWKALFPQRIPKWRSHRCSGKMQSPFWRRPSPGRGGRWARGQGGDTRWPRGRSFSTPTDTLRPPSQPPAAITTSVSICWVVDGCTHSAYSCQVGFPPSAMQMWGISSRAQLQATRGGIWCWRHWWQRFLFVSNINGISWVLKYTYFKSFDLSCWPIEFRPKTGEERDIFAELVSLSWNYWERSSC